MPETIRFVISVLVAALGVTVSQAQGLRELKAAPARSSLSLCGSPVEQPVTLPPPDSGPVIFQLAPCFERQGFRSQVSAEVYFRDIRLTPSRPSTGLWIPYDAAAERLILDDFQRLWKSHALVDLSVEVHDYKFSNGVVGKLVAYHITEQGGAGR